MSGWKLLLLASAILIAGCGEDNQEVATTRVVIADVDTTGTSVVVEESVSRSNQQIREAYQNYLKYAAKDDESRANALKRLAALEFEKSEELLKATSDEQTLDDVKEQIYFDQLDITISLLTTALEDYPTAKSNHRTLYQLAKAHDQRGNYQLSLSTLDKIVTGYPKSIYYTEAQFRLAEVAFSAKQYTLAEERYSSVIQNANNENFYEKALHKRGWARFKQEFYIEAADDFLEIIELNNFDHHYQLPVDKQSLFTEYFRAFGLTFAYIGGASPIEEYFEGNKHFEHLYATYLNVSKIYVSQQRYSDAVATLTEFTQNHPSSVYVPEATIAAIDILKQAGFNLKKQTKIEEFYNTYHPQSDYWKSGDTVDARQLKLVKNALRAQLLDLTAYYHQRFVTDNKPDDFRQAKRWYQNYLTHFNQYSRKDNIHYLFATLLAKQQDYQLAFKHYQLASFDSGIVINKNSAFDTIMLASTLMKQQPKAKEYQQWLEKLINYSLFFAQQYPNDSKTAKIIAHTTNLAYDAHRYDSTIELAQLLPQTVKMNVSIPIQMLKAHSLFKLDDYVQAEAAYQAILENQSLSSAHQKSAMDAVVLAIYYQGKHALENNDSAQAIHHYARITDIGKNTETAATGLYDAIALTIKTKDWNQSITLINRFKQRYPRHKYSHDVNKKLSVAYLNSKQGLAAASTLEQLSSNEQDKEYQSAALWKAAELYQENKQYKSAIRTYVKYAKAHRNDVTKYLEALSRLISIGQLAGNNADNIVYWRNRILTIDKRASNKSKTDRTRFIASNAALDLATVAYQRFNRIKLVRPLKQNLKKKKQYMQSSVSLFARASSYGIADTATQATFHIADIYQKFSQALLTSEIPKSLSDDEQEQYQILLEDQAFPFEEKAIEFHETNLLHTQNDIQDQWLVNSRNQLRQLFPSRYQRAPKSESVFNALH